MVISITPVITADDVIKSGACADGVYDAIKKLGSSFRAAMSVEMLRKILTTNDFSYVASAAKLNGYGDGDGDGNGYGYGDGNGNGYGDGYGNGDGNGDFARSEQ